jgi:hypothetical protein
MLQQSLIGILIPFLGTTLGAAAVFFLRENLSRNLQRALTGFAAGVMVAASIWSLLIPALEQSEESGFGHFSFLPAVIGLWIGTLFLLLLDKLIPHLHLHAEKAEGRKSSISKTAMLLLAVTIHNIPEGMAVGIVFAGFLSGSRTSRQAPHSRSPSASQFRTSPRAPSSRSRCSLREARNRAPFSTACSPASWNRLLPSSCLPRRNF